MHVSITIFRFIGASCMFLALNAPAQQSTEGSSPAPEMTIQDPNHVGSKGTIEVISKFRGADVLQYLSQVFNKVQTQPSFSLVKKPPLNGQGKSVVEFSILSDGSVGYTKLIHSSGHQSVDQALITAIQSGAPFPALSPESKGKPLKLRWHTVLNPKPAESKSH